MLTKKYFVYFIGGGIGPSVIIFLQKIYIYVYLYIKYIPYFLFSPLFCFLFISHGYEPKLATLEAQVKYTNTVSKMRIRINYAFAVTRFFRLSPPPSCEKHSFSIFFFFIIFILFFFEWGRGESNGFFFPFFFPFFFSNNTKKNISSFLFRNLSTTGGSFFRPGR